MFSMMNLVNITVSSGVVFIINTNPPRALEPFAQERLQFPVGNRIQDEFSPGLSCGRDRASRDGTGHGWRLLASWVTSGGPSWMSTGVSKGLYWARPVKSYMYIHSG